MFIGLLSTCTMGRFGKPLDFHSKGRLKCVFLNNWPFQVRPTLVDTNYNEAFLTRLLSVLINLMDVVMLSMIYMLEYLFQIK